MTNISVALVALLLMTSCSRRDSSNTALSLDSPVRTNLNSEACLPLPAKPKLVAISALIADPERFEGFAVTAIGFYYSSFEHSAIYPTDRDPTTSTWKDGLWIDGVSPFSDLSNEYVVVSGIFSSRRKGHLAQWPGSICAASIAVAQRHEP